MWCINCYAYEKSHVPFMHLTRIYLHHMDGLVVDGCYPCLKDEKLKNGFTKLKMCSVHNKIIIINLKK